MITRNNVATNTCTHVTKRLVHRFHIAFVNRTSLMYHAIVIPLKPKTFELVNKIAQLERYLLLF